MLFEKSLKEKCKDYKYNNKKVRRLQIKSVFVNLNFYIMKSLEICETFFNSPRIKL